MSSIADGSVITPSHIRRYLGWREPVMPYVGQAFWSHWTYAWDVRIR